MIINYSISLLSHSLIFCLAIITLIALFCITPAFCGEIHEAAATGDLAKVKALLKENPEMVFSEDNDGWMPLHQAAYAGHKNVAELLLANGANINAKIPRARLSTNDLKKSPSLIVKQQYDGETPLHVAAKMGHKEVVELLLAHGGEINTKGNGSETPLHIAAMKGHKEVVELLLIKGAKVNANEGGLGWTPLHMAALFGQRDVIAVLLAHGADVNARDGSSVTPLHFAALKGFKDIAEVLLAAHAEVNANQGGFTPLRLAARESHKDVVELLRKHGGHE